MARHGILHFLMVFARAVRALRPLVARHGGRLVKVEADSLLLAFPDAEQGLPCGPARWRRRSPA